MSQKKTTPAKKPQKKTSKTLSNSGSKKSPTKQTKSVIENSGARGNGDGGKTVFGKKDRGLGRGLSALMADVSVFAPEDAAPINAPNKKERKKPSAEAPVDNTNVTISRGISVIVIDQIIRNPEQPRKYFNPKNLAELTQSIKDKGVLQPILVRPVPDRIKETAHGIAAEKPLYQIVAGERRWQASLKAGLSSMPALIRELSDQEVLEIGVIENVQRTDLNPIEEAQAYRALIDQFGRTQKDVSDAIGKSRPHIANMLRLLTLPIRAQEALKIGDISTGHARAIVASPDPDALVEHIIERQLSVRDAEDWVRRLKKQASQSGGLGADLPVPPTQTEKTADIRAVEAELRDVLGITVDLRHRGPNGELRLKYRTDDQLANILTRLKRS